MSGQNSSICPTCGADISGFTECRDVCHELYYYTLQHPDPSFFIHQYVVDAYAAQHARENPKPITNAFALIGLYLCVEKNYSGRDVQKMHMLIAKRKQTWPVFIQPAERVAITVRDVLDTPAGPERDRMIREWARAVWKSWKKDHSRIEELVNM